MTTHGTRIDRISRVAIVVALLTLAAAPFAAAGDCYRASVPESIALPDGSTHPAGSMTVCRIRTLSPVAVLHSLSINGRDQGLFIGTRLSVESEDAATPAFFFSRANDSQILELQAVAYGNGGRFAAYRTDRIGRGSTPRVRMRGSFDLAGNTVRSDGSTLVLIAAAD